jgi:hypothetical protein
MPDYFPNDMGIRLKKPSTSDALRVPSVDVSTLSHEIYAQKKETSRPPQDGLALITPNPRITPRACTPLSTGHHISVCRPRLTDD